MPQLARKSVSLAEAVAEFRGQHVILLGAVVIAHAPDFRTAMRTAHEYLQRHPRGERELVHVKPDGTSRSSKEHRERMDLRERLLGLNERRHRRERLAPMVRLAA